MSKAEHSIPHVPYFIAFLALGVPGEILQGGPKFEEIQERLLEWKARALLPPFSTTIILIQSGMIWLQRTVKSSIIFIHQQGNCLGKNRRRDFWYEPAD
jgi:hypothetical protein